MIQIAVANVGACANASGMTRPSPSSPELMKALRDEKIDATRTPPSQFLTDTFELLLSGGRSMTPEKLHAMVGPEGGR